MKKMMLCLFLLGFAIQGHSQILLKEAKVEYKPVSMTIDPISNQLILTIPETVVGEFHQDPLAYVRKFDIAGLITQNKKSKYVIYEVNFKTRKGNLLARFDKDGRLTSTSQRFKDVRLPEEVKLQILMSYKNSEILRNKYVAHSKGWDLTKEVYRVKIRDGEKTRRLKLRRQADHYVLAGF